MIRRIETILTLLAAVRMMGIGLVGYAQPDIPRGDIPSHIPAHVRQQIKRLYSPARIERAHAAIHLGQMGAQAVPAIPFLIGMLGDSTQLVAEPEGVATSPGAEAARALVRIGKPAVEPLIAALKDEDSYIRGYAAEALGEIGDPRAVEPLIAALEDKDPSVSEKVAWALGEIKDRRAVEPLIGALHHEQLWVRRTTAEAMGKIGDRRAVEALIAAMRDEEALVRLYATEALGEIRDHRVVEPLIAALKDENWDVRRGAAEALRKITGKDFGEDSDKWLKWWDENKETAFDCCN
ncbi:MAG: HEAT repeat domain-containing protein [Thermodesulfobacteriota bacterium]